MKKMKLVLMFVAVFSIGVITAANHNRHHGQKTAKNNEDADPGADIEWPTPGTINDFTVPDEFTGGTGDGGEGGHEPGNGDKLPPARHQGKHRHSSRKH